MPRGKSGYNSILELNDEITACEKCKRLVEFRNRVLAGSSRYSGEEFWRKPVPGFGDIDGKLLVVGLAPAASGANRTGRVFTGDKSSEILVTSFHRNGLSNQAKSENRKDGLEYRDMFLSLAVRCVPPDNLPQGEEISNCLPYLTSEILLMKNLKCIVALGTVAFNSIKSVFKHFGHDVRGIKFLHGSFYDVGEFRLYSCYHPSPRNINTGRTSLDDITKVIGEAKEYAQS